MRRIDVTETGPERRAENAAIHRDLARARRGIEAMHTFLWTCAVVGLLIALLGSGPWRPAGVAFAAASAAGALQVRKRSFLWSLVFAVMTTAAAAFVVAVLIREAGAVPLDVAMSVLVVTTGAWWSVARMRRAERLLREHPAHFAARRITGRKR